MNEELIQDGTKRPHEAFTEATGYPSVDSAVGLGWLRKAQRWGRMTHEEWDSKAVYDFVRNCKTGTFDEMAVIVLTEEVLRLRVEVARLELRRHTKKRKRDNNESSVTAGKKGKE